MLLRGKYVLTENEDGQMKFQDDFAVLVEGNFIETAENSV